MPSDGEILSGCIAGHKLAWDAFVERYSRLIYWSIQKTLASWGLQSRQDLVLEIFQDVFTRLLEKEELKKLKSLEHLRKFLVVMAAHLARDRARSVTRAERKSVPLELPEGELVESPEPDPSQAAARAQFAESAAQVIDGLKERERACLEFHLVDGKSQVEIGEILGLPVNTVYTVIHRVKDKLKGRLERRGFRDFL